MAKGFLKGVKSELKKVVWPTKDQLIKNTVMVIGLVLVFSVVVLGFDMILEFADEKIWNVISEKLV